MLKSVFGFSDFYRTEFIKKIAADTKPGTKILDAGAGPCKFKNLFSHAQYFSQDFAKYEGSDHSYGQLDYISDITNIPVEDSSFDSIICTEVFEHIPRPDLALKEFSRIVKKGGQIVLTAPLGSGIHMPPYHFYGGFTPHWYDYFAKESNLTVRSIVANKGFFKHYGQESQRFLTILTPKSTTGRLLFFPFKLVLFPWFRIIMPLVCHALDSFDDKQEFTVGYHVILTKN